MHRLISSCLFECLTHAWPCNRDLGYLRGQNKHPPSQNSGLAILALPKPVFVGRVEPRMFTPVLTQDPLPRKCQEQGPWPSGSQQACALVLPAQPTWPCVSPSVDEMQWAGRKWGATWQEGGSHGTGWWKWPTKSPVFLVLGTIFRGWAQAPLCKRPSKQTTRWGTEQSPVQVWAWGWRPVLQEHR